MSELKLAITEDDIRGALQAALNQALDPKTCETFVREAISSLLRTGGFQSPSQLQRIFSDAAYSVARAAAEAEMSKPEHKERLERLVQEAFTKAFESPHRERLLERLGIAIEGALIGRD